jgi:calnexin
VDEAKIADPNASKPSDWDEDAPMTVPDMDAAKVRLRTIPHKLPDSKIYIGCQNWVVLV